jgi:acyl-coenzyme A synthetase/AMP-(fatty) acid ligase
LLSRTEGEPLIYHDRVDDVMILNGINIFPGAIEDALESHPDVLEAVAYAIKS